LYQITFNYVVCYGVDQGSVSR